MTRWPAGPRDSDGVWASHWYGSVHQSTGFARVHNDYPELSPTNRALAGGNDALLRSLGSASTLMVQNCETQTSDLRPQTSDLRPQTSDLRPQTSDLRPQTSDLRPQTSDLRPQTSDLRPQTSDLRPQTSDLRPLNKAIRLRWLLFIAVPLETSVSTGRLAPTVCPDKVAVRASL